MDQLFVSPPITPITKGLFPTKASARRSLNNKSLFGRFDYLLALTTAVLPTLHTGTSWVWPRKALLDALATQCLRIVWGTCLGMRCAELVFALSRAPCCVEPTAFLRMHVVTNACIVLRTAASPEPRDA